MNPKPEWRAVRIGLLVALGLLVAAVGIVGITSRNRLFERKVEYYSIFPDAAGLKEGNGVWYQGVEVGFISGIHFTADPDVQQVEVRYKVTAVLMPRIRAGTRASIKTLGLLGDKYLALETPSHNENEPIVLPGGQIAADRQINLAALGRDAQDLMENTLALSRNVNELVGLLVMGEGALPRLLNDKEAGAELVRNLVDISRNLETVTGDLARGRNLAGRMLADEAYGKQVSEDMAQAVRRTNEILQDIQDGRGVAGALFSKEGGGEKMVTDLAAASATLARIAAAVEKPGTVGNKIFLDEAYGKELAENLLSISRSLDSILKKVDRGEGSLGAVINDRQVYESMVVLVEGMKRSSLVNWYLRKTGENGVQDLQKRRAEGKKP
jgi:phospholipid/cholesterol/gamma-HCH transport system substrate-binding protein